MAPTISPRRGCDHLSGPLMAGQGRTMRLGLDRENGRRRSINRAMTQRPHPPQPRRAPRAVFCQNLSENWAETAFWLAWAAIWPE